MATAPIVPAATGRPVVGAPSGFSSPSPSPSPVGLWYGNKSSSRFPPTTEQLMHLYMVNKIQKMWLWCENVGDGQDILNYINSHGEANIQVVLHIPTTEAWKIAEMQEEGNEWIRLITDYQPVISYVCLGIVREMNNNDITKIGRAMDKIHSINAINPIKVSTLVNVNVIFGSYDPNKSPSSYRFLEKLRKVLSEVFTRLQPNSTPLFVKAFPYLAIPDNIDQQMISRNHYLLEEGACTYMRDDLTKLEYKYVFDAMVDSISYAIKAMGSDVDISVVSGWPTAGSTEATIANARKYNRNLLRHVNEATPGKTKRIDHFIFSLQDEDKLPPNDLFDWKHYGTFALWKNETFPEAT